MASVRINSGYPEAADRPKEWPKEMWSALLFQKKQFATTHIKHDCRCIIEFIEDAEEMWEHLKFKSKEDLIQNGFELDPSEVSLAVQWLKIKDPDFPVPLIDAVTMARDMPLADHGNGPGRGNKRVDNVNSFKESKGGNRKEYLLRRLSRDHPEALDRIQAGELTTRKAAIEYGIIKVKTPMERALFELHRLSKQELQKIHKLIGQMIISSTKGQ